MPHSGLSAQAHPLPLLLKLYPASLPPTSKKQKKAAKQESFQQNGYAKNWVKPLRQAQVEREQSIRHSKSGPSRSDSHAAAILIFLPIFLPHRRPDYPSPPRKAAAQKKVFQQLAPRFKFSRTFWPTPNAYFHSSTYLSYKYAIWSISGCPIRCRSRLYPDEKTKNPYKQRKLLSYAKEFPWL